MDITDNVKTRVEKNTGFGVRRLLFKYRLSHF